jgi:hypothetical protein
MRKKLEIAGERAKVPALAAVLALLGGWCVIFSAL